MNWPFLVIPGIFTGYLFVFAVSGVSIPETMDQWGVLGGLSLFSTFIWCIKKMDE